MESDNTKTSILSQKGFHTSDIHVIEKECRLSLFWKQDLSWYTGTVQKVEELGQKLSVIVLYDDGMTERIEDVADHKWRKLVVQKLTPVFYMDVSERERRDVLSTLKVGNICGKSSSLSPDRVGDDYINISLQDFSTLQKDTWVSDEVIHALVTKLPQTADHKENRRVAYVSSQLIIFARSEDNNPHTVLREWLRGVELHEVDAIIWPLHVAKAIRWCLCIAYPSSKDFISLDPYHPRHGRISGSICRTVPRGLTVL